MVPLVSVTIVTTNDAKHLRRCLESVFSQDYSAFEVVIVDNASSDGTRQLLAQLHYPIRTYFNEANLGFSKSQNIAIQYARGQWILCLNPDTKLEVNFISELVRAGELDPRIGMVCPKILRLDENVSSNSKLLDSTGLYMTLGLRHHDRGSQRVDSGQFETPEYVFGYTGAAVLFRREMIDDVSILNEFMDEDFYLYREDADVSWRAKLLGWRCLYTPFAVGYHIRRVFAHNRRSLPAFINMHSTKNRFLMRLQNMTPDVYRKVFWQTTLRDLQVIAYVLCREWGSLPGLWFVLKNLKKTLKKRALIQSRRRISDKDLALWFDNLPVTMPLEPEHLGKMRAFQRVDTL